ncbi:MAG: hypothetical protein Q9228_002725 [Teloschistes exilis]
MDHAIVAWQRAGFRAIVSGDQTRQINLPEEDSRVVRAMIQYLYTGNFWDFGMGEVSPEETTEPEDDLTQAADELAAIYIVADKYQLPDLRTLIVGKLTTHIDIQRPPIEFLQMARKTYTYMPESEDIFRTFFKETATELPKPSEMAQNLSHIFNDCIMDGGIMAIDMFAALCAKNSAEVNSARKQGGRELSASIELLVN